MAISAKLVKELREKTGAGMMDCKNALTETDGDLEKAVDLLREKGMAKAAKKADRVAAEGLAQVKVEGNQAVIVEVNSETDFVAKNEQFTQLIETLMNHLLAKKPSTVEEALEQPLEGTSQSVNEYINAAIAKIGEKISLRRFQVIEKTDAESFGSYIHMGGRIAVLAYFEGQNEDAARDVAMHIAAVNPRYVTKDEIPADVVEHEKEVLKQQALNEGKPENIVEKMVVGRLNKFYQEVSLVEQDFVKDPDQKVKKYLESNGLSIKSFVRFEVGEGLEKRSENFAEEVQAQIKK